MPTAGIDAINKHLEPTSGRNKPTRRRWRHRFAVLSSPKGPTVLVGPVRRSSSASRAAHRRETRYSIAAAFRMQTIVAEAGFCDTLRIMCGRSER
jgi:hypothetical protein